jgi:mono/diheme cytochrome c family protein
MSKLLKCLSPLAVLLTAQVVQAADSAFAQPDAAPPAPAGASLFAKHCAMCHKPADLARRVQSAGDAGTGKGSLTSFLAAHGRADPAADAAIIDWLLNGGT